MNVCQLLCVYTGEGTIILNTVVRNGPAGTVTFEEKLEGGKKGSIPGRGNSKRTGPKVGAHLVWDSKEANAVEKA